MPFLVDGYIVLQIDYGRRFAYVSGLQIRGGFLFIIKTTNKGKLPVSWTDGRTTGQMKGRSKKGMSAEVASRASKFFRIWPTLANYINYYSSPASVADSKSDRDDSFSRLCSQFRNILF